MISFPLANANASLITVTGVAASIKSLIDTAGATLHSYRLNLDALDMNVEGGDVRVIYDGNTPTASKGLLVKQGIMLSLRHVPLDSVKLIAVSGSPTCSVQIGTSEDFETTVMTGGGGGASTVTGNVASGATDSGNPVKAGAVYNTTAPTYTNGQRTDLQADVNGSLNIDERYAAQAEDNTYGVIAQALKPLAVSTYSWTLFQNLGANATLNVKASAGSIKSIYCHNLNANSRYIQIHKTATTPGGGAVPALTFLVPGSGVVAIDGSVLGENGFYCTTGIAFAFSTTEATYTAGTAADQMTHIMYV